VEQVRVDQWLWAVRLFKTRSQATEACRAGHVKVNGNAAKAASPVKPGDRVEARAHGRDRILEVVQVLDKRVGPPVAAAALVDHSPPLPPKEEEPFGFVRERGAGRPTKRERRTLDRFRSNGR
jgi:ribosome-associated heat shock protein Hsp15